MSEYTAHLVHRAPGRYRLRVPQGRGDLDFFETIADSLSVLEGVLSVQANPKTASVLILHEGLDIDVLTHSLGDRITLDPDAPYVAPSRLNASVKGLNELDAWIARISRGGSRVDSVLFLLLVVSGLVQLARGQVLAPASSLLWYAFELLRHTRQGVGEAD